MYFAVTYRDKSGARTQIEIEAASRDGVWPILKERGISAIRVDEGRVKKNRSKSAERLCEGGKHLRDTKKTTGLGIVAKGKCRETGAAVPTENPSHEKLKGGDSRKVNFSKVAVEAFRRAHALKKFKHDTGPTPLLDKRSLIPTVGALLLTMISSYVVPQILSSGTIRLRPEDRSVLAKRSVDMLAIALGRYRFHVGAYPTTEEGLEVLAYCQPDEMDKIRQKHPGWNGPYINRIRMDPWDQKFVYNAGKDDDYPILYSCGSDRKAGTADDIRPNAALYHEQSWDTSWSHHWMPARLRGDGIAAMRRGATNASTAQVCSTQSPHCRQQTVFERTSKDGAPNCVSDEVDDFDDASNITIPLIVGVITFVVTWPTLRLIFSRS